MNRTKSLRATLVMAGLSLACTACLGSELGEAGAEGNSSGGGLIRGDAPTEASATSAGPYRVRAYGVLDSLGVRDGWDYGDADIYYPENAAPPFALVAIIPGFISGRSWIEEWGPFVASHGIVAMVLDPNLPTDQPSDRGKALLDAIKTLKAENTRAAGPLNGKLDSSRAGLIGWSMGGGGALYAATSDPSLKAVVAITPWEPFGRYYDLRVPTLFFAGTSDTLAGGMSQPFYDSIPDKTPKLIFEKFLAGHTFACAPSGEWGVVGRFGLSWLKVFLEGDDRYKQFLKNEPSGASDFRHNL